MPLISIKLGVNEVLQVVLVVRTQTLNRARSFAVARANVTRAGIGKAAVIACSFPEAVEPLSAIGLGTGPFADNGPLVGPGKFWAEAASSSDVVRGTHGNLTWGEDLVLMGIKNHVLVARRGWGHEAVPVAFEILESIVNAGCVVGADSCHGLVAGLVETLDLLEVEGATQRLVQELDCRDNVGVARVALGEVLDCGDGLAHCISLLPIDGSVAAAVVEAVLRPRCSMEIKQNLEIGISSPADCLIQDIQLPLDVRVAIQRCDGPVADWDSNMIQAILANLLEVVLGDPGVPVVLESGRRTVLAEGLSVSVLVDDCQARKPWLKD